MYSKSLSTNKVIAKYYKMKKATENIVPSKLIIISAPSGCGKSTIINHIMKDLPELEFSISITSRPPRGKEENGKEYYFVSPAEFKEKIKNDELIEYVEVYKDTFYGSLKSEVERIASQGKVALFDIDVEGALKVKAIYGRQALSIFIAPPNIDALKERLEKRGTDTKEIINTRLDRAEYEISFAKKFDKEIMNDDLEKAISETKNCIESFIAI